jgi:hypothetical protein
VPILNSTRDDTIAKMKPYKVAILWRGDAAKRAAATPQNNRYHRIFEELETHGIHAEPAVFAEDLVDEVEKQLMTVDGVLVWVNPLDDGLTREKLDPMLREVASKGPWVSAHPDVILKMGVKEVLYRTKHLGWGTDTHLYCTAAEFRGGFPARLASGGARVLKRPFRSWKHVVAACRRRWRWRPSWPGVRTTLLRTDASLISHSSRVCPTG